MIPLDIPFSLESFVGLFLSPAIVVKEPANFNQTNVAWRAEKQCAKACPLGRRFGRRLRCGEDRTDPLPRAISEPKRQARSGY
jgi:hypothetical protein